MTKRNYKIDIVLIIDQPVAFMKALMEVCLLFGEEIFSTYGNGP